MLFKRSNFIDNEKLMYLLESVNNPSNFTSVFRLGVPAIGHKQNIIVMKTTPKIVPENS